MTIELYLFERDPVVEFTFYNQLNLAQQEKFNQLGAKRQVEFGFTRLLLNHLVRQKLGLQADFFAIENEHRPPTIACFSEAGWVFSISHSSNLIAIATTQPQQQAAPSCLGLDVECYTKPRGLSAARLFCNAQQLEQLHDLSEESAKQAYYLRLWTQKEAYFKARHLPVLNPNLKGLCFTESHNQTDLYSGLWESATEQSYQLSVYHQTLCSIEVYLARCSEGGNFDFQTISPMNWSAYRCEINSE